ncbi:MAG: MarC family protein [Chloroherpetonaceae bacterium]|nr:MarC family protein [Chloroherpetonaceae bacterium]
MGLTLFITLILSFLFIATSASINSEITFDNFLLCFIPLFVAIDVIGTLPLFIGLTSSFQEKTKRRLTTQAVLTAFALSLIIMVAGKGLFDLLGISISDFRIAGGIILLLLAIMDLISPGADESKQPADPSKIGIVPLGIPLVIGPASLTTLLILRDTYGFQLTLIALVLNLLIVFLLFYFSGYAQRLIGPNGAKAVAKVAALFLAAIAVMMIRVGISDVIKSF